MNKFLILLFTIFSINSLALNSWGPSWNNNWGSNWNNGLWNNGWNGWHNNGWNGNWGWNGAGWGYNHGNWGHHWDSAWNLDNSAVLVGEQN